MTASVVVADPVCVTLLLHKSQGDDEGIEIVLQDRFSRQSIPRKVDNRATKLVLGGSSNEHRGKAMIGWHVNLMVLHTCVVHVKKKVHVC